MKVIYKFTDKEVQLLTLINAKGSLSTADNFGGWRDSLEWNSFRDNCLIAHHNADNRGEYIRYSLTDLGKEALRQVVVGVLPTTKKQEVIEHLQNHESTKRWWEDRQKNYMMDVPMMVVHAIESLLANGTSITSSKDNWNNYVVKNGLNKWHKVDKSNFTPPKDNTNILFFTNTGTLYCGYYKGSIGFTCYGINKTELTDVEVTYWKNLEFPEEYQQMLDEMDTK